MNQPYMALLNSGTGTIPALVLTLVTLIQCTPRTALAGDPDILSDFIVPENSTNIDSSFFTFKGFRGMFSGDEPKTLKVTKASMVEFPALNGQSVSYAVLQFPPASINPPHTHPRAAELLFVVEGTLEVGFVDTKNVLFNKTLVTGDMFVFPKGVVHFQYNRNHNEFATAVSAFGSASAGLVSIPVAVFAAGIDDVILAASFRTDVSTIKKIELGIKKP